MSNDAANEGRKALSLSQAEVALIRDHTFAPTRLTAFAIAEERKLELHLTCEDAEELLGYVAAGANHEKRKKVAAALDRLFEKLERFEASFPR